MGEDKLCAKHEAKMPPTVLHQRKMGFADVIEDFYIMNIITYAEVMVKLKWEQKSTSS